MSEVIFHVAHYCCFLFDVHQMSRDGSLVSEGISCHVRQFLVHTLPMT